MEVKRRKGYAGMFVSVSPSLKDSRGKCALISNSEWRGVGKWGKNEKSEKNRQRSLTGEKSLIMILNTDMGNKNKTSILIVTVFNNVFGSYIYSSKQFHQWDCVPKN